MARGAQPVGGQSARRLVGRGLGDAPAAQDARWRVAGSAHSVGLHHGGRAGVRPARPAQSRTDSVALGACSAGHRRRVGDRPIRRGDGRGRGRAADSDHRAAVGAGPQARGQPVAAGVAADHDRGICPLPRKRGVRRAAHPSRAAAEHGRRFIARRAAGRAAAGRRAHRRPRSAAGADSGGLGVESVSPPAFLLNTIRKVCHANRFAHPSPPRSRRFDGAAARGARTGCRSRRAAAHGWRRLQAPGRGAVRRLHPRHRHCGGAQLWQSAANLCPGSRQRAGGCADRRRRFHRPRQRPQPAAAPDTRPGQAGAGVAAQAAGTPQPRPDHRPGARPARDAVHHPAQPAASDLRPSRRAMAQGQGPVGAAAGQAQNRADRAAGQRLPHLGADRRRFSQPHRGTGGQGAARRLPRTPAGGG